MTVQDQQADCQLPCVHRIGERAAEMPPQSLARQVKLAIRRRLDPDSERTLKKRLNALINRLGAMTGRSTLPLVEPHSAGAPRLKAGDAVRVRSRQEIEATLNHWRQLKGCTFMPEMLPYCGSTLRVLKPMERFVDERDLRVKRSGGIVLLEGVVCQGTAEFGRCDRACHLFWREEWLERLESVSLPNNDPPASTR